MSGIVEPVELKTATDFIEAQEPILDFRDGVVSGVMLSEHFDKLADMIASGMAIPKHLLFDVLGHKEE